MIWIPSILTVLIWIVYAWLYIESGNQPDPAGANAAMAFLFACIGVVATAAVWAVYGFVVLLL